MLPNIVVFGALLWRPCNMMTLFGKRVWF